MEIACMEGEAIIFQCCFKMKILGRGPPYIQLEELEKMCQV